MSKKRRARKIANKKRRQLKTKASNPVEPAFILYLHQLDAPCFPQFALEAYNRLSRQSVRIKLDVNQRVLAIRMLTITFKNIVANAYMVGQFSQMASLEINGINTLDFHSIITRSGDPLAEN